MSLPSEQRREWIRSRREQRKQTRRARLRRQTFRYLLLAVLLFSGIGCFCYLPWQLNDIEHQIVVHNNKVVSEEQVRTALKDVADLPLYKLAPHELERKVEALAMVNKAFVRRYSLPRRRLVVEVLEEFPWASYGLAPDQPIRWIICESGRIVSTEEFPRAFKPELKIYGQPNLQLQASDVIQWSTWLNLIARQTGFPVQSVDLRNSQNIVVQDGDLCLKLGAPDSSLTRRLCRLASLQTVIVPIKDRLEFIDLGLDSNIPLKLAKKTDNGKFLREKLNRSQL
jgi:cell division septal protein FtsQ